MTTEYRYRLQETHARQLRTVRRQMWAALIVCAIVGIVVVLL